MNLPNTSTNAHGTATTLMYEGTPHTYVVTHSPRPCLRPTALTTTTLEAYTKAKAEALNGAQPSRCLSRCCVARAGVWRYADPRWVVMPELGQKRTPVTNPELLRPCCDCSGLVG